MKLDVSFAEYSLFYRALLQKRPVILRSLIIVATPYQYPKWVYKQRSVAFPILLVLQIETFSTKLVQISPKSEFPAPLWTCNRHALKRVHVELSLNNRHASR